MNKKLKHVLAVIISLTISITSFAQGEIVTPSGHTLPYSTFTMWSEEEDDLIVLGLTVYIPETISGSLIIPDNVTLYNDEGDIVQYPIVAIGDEISWVGDGEDLDNYSCGDVDVKNTGLSSVSMGNNIVYISPSAFAGFTELVSVNLNSSVLKIGAESFNGCTKLSSINIPASVEHIGAGAFAHCTSLTSVSVPASVRTLKGTFFSCSSLVSIELNEGLESIDDAFGKGAFAGCSSLTEMEIPSSVSHIGPREFSGCTALINLKLNNVYADIDESAFWDVKRLIIDEPIPMWDYYYGNGSLIGGAISANSYIEDGYIYDSEEKRVLIMYYGTDDVLTIPSSVYLITNNYHGDFMPPTVKKVIVQAEDCEISGGGYSPSYGPSAPIFCNIEEIVYSDNVKVARGSFINYYHSTNDNLKSITFGLSVEKVLGFRGCISLTSIDLPESLQYIEDGAFYGCTGLSELVLPTSLRRIGQYAFANCSQITSLDIPESVEYLYSSAFDGCDNLSRVNMHGATPPELYTDLHDDQTDNSGIPYYIPCGSYKDYFASYQWRRMNIVDTCAVMHQVTIINTGSNYIEYSCYSNTGKELSWGDFEDSITITVLDSLELRLWFTDRKPRYEDDESAQHVVSFKVNDEERLGTCLKEVGEDRVYYRGDIVIDTDYVVVIGIVPYEYHNVTVTSSDGDLGKVDGSGSGRFALPDSLKYYATPKVGNSFMGWSNGETDNPLTIYVISDTSISAIFTRCQGYGDTVWKYETDTVYITSYDTINIYDTTIVFDTITLTDYLPVHDTAYIDIHDTTFITKTDTVTNIVYDTITNTITDTVTNIVFDTTVVYNTDTLWLCDTVLVHDTIYVYDTVYVGVDNVEAVSARIYTSGGQIVVEGSQGNMVWLYDVNGRVLETKRDALNVGDNNSRLSFDIPASGAYLVKIGNYPARKVVVVR